MSIDGHSLLGHPSPVLPACQALDRACCCSLTRSCGLFRSAQYSKWEDIPFAGNFSVTCPLPNPHHPVRGRKRPAVSGSRDRPHHGVDTNGPADASLCLLISGMCEAWRVTGRAIHREWSRGSGGRNTMCRHREHRYDEKQGF